jgi:hypothetical protein
MLKIIQIIKNKEKVFMFLKILNQLFQQLHLKDNHNLFQDNLSNNKHNNYIK